MDSPNPHPRPHPRVHREHPEVALGGSGAVPGPVRTEGEGGGPVVHLSEELVEPCVPAARGQNLPLPLSHPLWPPGLLLGGASCQGLLLPQVEYSRVGSKVWASQRASSNTTEIKDLLVDTQYTVRVSAFERPAGPGSQNPCGDTARERSRQLFLSFQGMSQRAWKLPFLWPGLRVTQLYLL